MDDYQIDVMLGREGILTRACRELVEMGLATQTDSIVTGMSEDEKRLHRIQIYREITAQHS